jgi:uncharacterized protein YciI
MQQFLYLLRLNRTLHRPERWTDADRDVVAKHFAYLQRATELGQVIFAGRTDESPDKTFGLVVFEAADEPAARRFMEQDPALSSGVMNATLHPYRLALQRKP